MDDCRRHYPNKQFLALRLVLVGLLFKHYVYMNLAVDIGISTCSGYSSFSLFGSWSLVSTFKLVSERECKLVKFIH